MNKEDFDKNIKRGSGFERIDYSGFWRGYRRGLCRMHYGEEYGTEEEHRTLMELANDTDNKSRLNHGLGYRAGFAGKAAKPLFENRKGMVKR